MSFKTNMLPKKVKHTRPWFGLQCRTARKRYNIAKKHNASLKSEASRRVMINFSKKYKSTVKKYHSKYTTNFQNKIRKLSTKKPKEYWKLINSLEKKNDEIPITMTSMFEYFKKLNVNVVLPETDTESEPLEIPLELDNNETLNVAQSQLNNPITANEIEMAIKSLKLNKASGIDNIINEYLISMKHLLLPTYEKLFNIILDTGIVPSDWTKGNIIPIYKNKGSKSDPTNYRPVTLLSCLGKVFTYILNTRLSKYLESNNILNKNQGGFRKEYSTTDNIMILYSLTEYFKNQKRKLY